ncbi:MAG: TetR/AcrR family transcriptional regulator [Anaerolineaceae bacterium]|nr:TetR/AcrR family transcriptional regulator [Anaerolineaceae bacterium]
MPKAFSEQEKEIIRAQMREKGRKLFEKQGLRKTTVEELAAAAAISKGAFYIFFDSKEELYMEIMEEIERDIHNQIMAFAMQPDGNAQANISNLLKNFLFTMDDTPILKNFSRADLDYLVRKLPPERVLQHTDNDVAFMQLFLERIKQEGIPVKASPQVISDLIKSLFFISLHREDFNNDGYENMYHVLIDLVAGYIAGVNHAESD